MRAVGRDGMQCMPQCSEGLILLLDVQGSQERRGSIPPLWELLSNPQENPRAVSHGAQPGLQHTSASGPRCPGGEDGSCPEHPHTRGPRGVHLGVRQPEGRQAPHSRPRPLRRPCERRDLSAAGAGDGSRHPRVS